MNKANWSLEQAIKERVEKEDWFDWSQKPTPVLVNNYKPQKLVLTETAKYVFAKSISLFKL